MAILFATFFAVVACTSQGTIVNPFERRLVWFSHISGEDIRAACAAKTADRYRLTYYANRARQVRVYDINTPVEGDENAGPVPGTGPGVPDGMVLAAVDILDGPVDFTRLPVFDDVFRPWRPKRREFTLPPGVMGELRFDMIQGGLVRRTKVGMVLASPSYFWLAAACVDGQFHFQAWEYPDEDFARLSFPSALFGLDGSPVTPRLPPNSTERIVNYPSYQKQALEHRDNYNHYDLIVTEDGVEPGRIYERR